MTATADDTAWTEYMARLDRIAAEQAEREKGYVATAGVTGPGPTLLAVARRVRCDPPADEVAYHEAAHLLVALKMGVPTGSASVSARGGLVIIDSEFLDRMDADPDIIPRVAAVQAAGAIGAILYHSDYAADPRSYLSDADARNIDSLKARWEEVRPVDEWPYPFTAAARVLATDPVRRCVYPLANLLQHLGSITPENARVMIAEAEQEVAGVTTFR